MNILIIGGTGLISTSITAQLLARGDDVTLYNRGRRAPRLQVTARRISGDRTDFPAFEREMAAAGPFDVVIDMVCFRPEEAESAVRALAGRCGHYLFCSTVDVYQKPYVSYPIREDHPLGGINEYGRNKRLCEEILLKADARGELPVTVLRPAHTYGEGGGLIHSLGWGTSYIDRVRRGLPIVVHGDGTSLWASCHIDDVSRAFVTACGNDLAVGRAYNLAGGEWHTWNDYHRKVALALGAPEPRLVRIPAELLARIAPEQATVAADNFCFSNIFETTAAHDDLGFHQSVAWAEGVRRTVAWLDANGRVESSDADPLPDRIVAAWERLSAAMERELKAP